VNRRDVELHSSGRDFSYVGVDNQGIHDIINETLINEITNEGYVRR